MDRIRFGDNVGGRPITEDDKLFEQNAIRNAIFGLCKAFFDKWNDVSGEENRANCVVWGCGVTPSGSDRIVDAGYIIIDGEIYEVEGETVAGVTGSDEIFATAGSTNQETRTFKSGTGYAVQEVRRASLAAADPASPPANSVNLTQSPSDDQPSDPTKSQSLIGGINGSRGLSFVPWAVISTSLRDATSEFKPRDMIYNYTEDCYQYQDLSGNWWSTGKLTRLTTTQRNALTGVRSGTQIYNLTSGKIQVYNGSSWEEVTSA